MKKYIICFFTVMLLLALSACGGKDPAADDTASADIPSAAVSSAASSSTDPPPAPSAEPEPVHEDGVTEDPGIPFGQYRTVEELLAVLDGSALDEKALPPADGTPEPQSVDESAEYAGVGETTIFSDEGWEEPAVEFWDWQSLVGQERDMESYKDIEIPEGLDEYFPEGFDLEGMMDGQ